ncbi:hypothetical protein EZY14_020160 [Kordia sp. TARA_039_SRF]|mgnify:CR=1 FL=1|nr:hypothetical protein EZY14_020160 [Kordia sp. TARA_039_SRF]MEC8067945.1 hypothetical protein [Pseudomonadota bacterium]
MKNFKLLALVAVLTLTLTACASKNKLDSDLDIAVSAFKTHDEIREKFKLLEEKIDIGENVYRIEVHEMGFDPSETAVEIMDWVSIGHKFTAGGNEVLAAAISAANGQLLPKPVSECIAKGKKCTAYRVKVNSKISEEIPEGTWGTFKSMVNLKEIREITRWSFSGIIVFDADQAVYAQVEEDIAPNRSIKVEENSLIKKIGGFLP